MVLIQRLACLALVIGLVGCSQVQPELTTLVLPEHALLYSTTGQVWVSDPAAQSTQPIHTVPGDVQSAIWLHTSKAIVYVVKVNDYFQIWQQSLASSEQQPVLLVASHTLPEQLTVSANDHFLSYLEGDVVFVFDMTTLQRSRIYEGATAIAWSPTGRQFVVSTLDQRLLNYTYALDGTLAEPTTIVARAVAAPVFVNNHMVAFQGMVGEQYGLQLLDLTTQLVTTISSLRFDTSDATVRLVLAPDAKTLLYTRPDDSSHFSTVWAIPLTQDVPQLILNNAKGLGWTTDSKNIYYQSTVDQALYQATATGLNKMKLIPHIQSINVLL